jgi:hypothetical protein
MVGLDFSPLGHFIDDFLGLFRGFGWSERPRRNKRIKNVTNPDDL